MNKRLKKILDSEHNEPVAHICHVGKLESDQVACERCGEKAELAVVAHLTDPDDEYNGEPAFDAQMYLCLACVMSLISL
ncbi:MAG TPA: hypothetical protein VNN79_06000, partial [Actinomycetota bacterium]|nr:hypothetical protein [Actinomycetota bacterium]